MICWIRIQNQKRKHKGNKQLNSLETKKKQDETYQIGLYFLDIVVIAVYKPNLKGTIMKFLLLCWLL